jgi:hypothetical protein
MTQLANDISRNFEGNLDEVEYAPLSGATVYQGAAVTDAVTAGLKTGTVHQLVAGEDFVGFNRTPATNTPATPAVNLTIATKGWINLSGITGLTAACGGAPVFASDSNTFFVTGLTQNVALGNAFNGTAGGNFSLIVDTGGTNRISTGAIAYSANGSSTVYAALTNTANVGNAGAVITGVTGSLTNAAGITINFAPGSSAKVYQGTVDASFVQPITIGPLLSPTNGTKIGSVLQVLSVANTQAKVSFQGFQYRAA